ncbi:hypothetical protein BDV11DRAFT_175970 [Aspergillus similis]
MRRTVHTANDWPTIKAASSFVGLGVLSTDEHIGGTGPDGNDGEYYVNTAHFYSQIRNLRIDITDTDPNAYVCAIHYQIAQATSLQEVELIATTGTTQQGIYAENGSGGMMSDITFTGGNFGFFQIIWDWGWVWKSIDIWGADVGFRLVSDDDSGNIGSASFIDSKFTDVTTAIVMAPASEDPGSGTTGLILDNTKIDGPLAIRLGKAISRQVTTRTRTTDDTAAVQQVFNDYGDGSKIIFVGSGTYILTDTVTIPKDAKIHGEAWSQFAASGDAFSDARDPDLDDAYNDMTQVSIYVARGFLIESTNATWLYGTSSEHSVYYQYNFHGAQNIFTTMIQTEAPYYQPTPKLPVPFSDQVGVYDSDPDYSCSGGDFDGCDEAWAVIMTGCQNIHIGGVGTHSNYDNVRLQHVIAIGAEYILVADGNGVLSTDNLAIESHLAWAQISIFDVPSQGQAPNPGDGDDSDGGCNTDDNTWTDVDTREGEYFNTSVLDINLIDVPNGRQFITIVNLTPYKFVYQNDTSHTYQMDEWDFGDIPPGRSRQCVMDYYDGKQDYDPVDDKGEAYYVVEGTDRGKREFEDSQVGVPVSFVITGSEDYGYYTSLSFDTSGPDAWMSNLQATIGDRQIKHVVMPGSHDSGMDRISTSWFGSSPNTQTQGLSIYGQLKVGVRYFDLRVVRLNDGTFVATHVNDGRAGTIAGGAASRQRRLARSSSSGRYLVDILEYDVEDRYWNETTMQEFYSKLDRIENRCPNLLEENDSNTLDELTIGTYLDSSDGAGCVIFINGGTTDPNIQEVTTEELDTGIYGTGRLPRTDNWSEKSDPKEVADDQVSYYPNLRATIGGEADTFYISQWVATLSACQILYWYGMMEMSPSGFPTVMLMDYAGVRLQGEYDEEYWGAELKTLAIGLNLYLASKNCDISTVKNPLGGSTAESTRTNGLLQPVSSSGGTWNGIIFANGTVLGDPPANYNPWKESVLRNRTMFASRMVLPHNIHVSDLWCKDHR